MISVSSLAEKRGWKCESCGHATRVLQRHHTFLRRMKKHPELDDERNLALVCMDCHEHKVNSYEFRHGFWQVQKARYSDMLLWYFELPVKCKLENYA